MKKDLVYFLLVDDLEENLLSLEALLRRPGLVMLKARSGSEALELLLKNEIALALLDVQMPGMNGFELAELMRGTERTRRVPIIFLTAGTTDSQRRFRGYEAGAVDFLQKPIEADILRSKASVFFELYAQRHELEVRAEENKYLLEESRQYAVALKEADKHKDEFIATLAHELRNPLAPIRNGLTILRMAPNSSVAEDTRAMMERQVTHLVRLIDDLLDVSRVSQGKIDLRKRYVTLKSIIQVAVETSKPMIDELQHTLTLTLPDEELGLDADLTRLAQVVSNLLNNAAKYTPNGGVIALSAHKDGDQVVIEIKDNGLGIPADMLSQVFELFTQIDVNLERSRGGLGIGLALVKRLVHMHNGTIRAESAGLGMGSIFTLYLPLSPRPEKMAEEKPVAESSAGVHLKILVVDDNIESAKTTGWMLEMIGHESALAHDGITAIELAKKLQPDVVMLDIGLPGKNGYDICRELRADPLFKNTVFIAQTGWGQAKDRQMAKEAGFDHHLTKPVDFDHFTRLLSEISTHKAMA